MPVDCPECDGTGTLVATSGAWSRWYETCPLCDGAGVIDPSIEEEPTE